MLGREISWQGKIQHVSFYPSLHLPNVWWGKTENVTQRSESVECDRKYHEFECNWKEDK